MLRKNRRRPGALAVVPIAVLALACGGTALAPSAMAGTTAVQVPAGTGGAPFDQPRTVTIPNGWHLAVWARVPDARLEAWAPDRRLLVSQPDKGTITLLTPRSGRPPVSSTLVSGLNSPHGMAFRGSTLYVAEGNQVDVFTYSAGTVSGRKILVGGLPDAQNTGIGGYAHGLKSVAVAANGVVFVSVGSSANIAPSDRTASPQRATILRWTPATHKLDVYARGVRNGTGLAISPAGDVWTAVNNRDNIPYPYAKDYDGDGSSDLGKVMQSYVNDHPMEEIAKLTPGRDLGWPYCDPDPDTDPGVKGSAQSFAKPAFVRDMDTNADGSKLDCSKLPRIDQGMPAHSAPLGMSFGSPGGPFGVGALVASHGSWNRTPPQAPAVSYYAYANGNLGHQQVLVSGFQNADGSRWGRPVAAVAFESAVYISDDAAGAVYRLTAG